MRTPTNLCAYVVGLISTPLVAMATPVCLPANSSAPATGVVIDPLGNDSLPFTSIPTSYFLDIDSTGKFCLGGIANANPCGTPVIWISNVGPDGSTPIRISMPGNHWKDYYNRSLRIDGPPELSLGVWDGSTIQNSATGVAVDPSKLNQVVHGKYVDTARYQYGCHIGDINGLPGCMVAPSDEHLLGNLYIPFSYSGGASPLYGWIQMRVVSIGEGQFYNVTLVGFGYEPSGAPPTIRDVAGSFC
jgi:hypothetical protein